MSYSQLVVFRGGQAEGDEEYRNGHGSSPMVWDTLLTRYGRLLYPDTPLTGAIPGGPRAWMDLITRWRELPLREWEMIALLWTCDYAVTKREDFNKLVTALRRFEDAHAVPNQVCHLVSMADRIEECTEDETVEAVALYATSCGTNAWVVQRESAYRPYDLTKDEDHWFIFEQEELELC